VNALTSLIGFYELPLLMLISLRGGAAEHIAAQRPMGDATNDVLAACGIRILSPSSTVDLIGAVARPGDDRVAIVAEPALWPSASAIR
jgi:sulfopyruvate decarboxylase TPP-binding subunit